MSDQRLLFHENYTDNMESLSYSKVIKLYRAPDWCKLGNEALHQTMGCWSLTGSPDKISKEYCMMCDFCKEFAGNLREVTDSIPAQDNEALPF